MFERRNTGYKRPSYGADFKASAVRLILEHGRPISQGSQELGVSASALREWLIAAKCAASGGSAVVGGSQRESEELARLKRELRIVTEEREILKKRRPSSRERAAKVSLYRRGEGQLADSNDVSGAGGLRVGLLRMENSPAV